MNAATRLTSSVLAVTSAAALATATPPANADSAKAYCVLSWHKSKMPPVEGPCIFSQRQGNANITFRQWAFDFPLAEDGKAYTRINREGDEAGPVFTREGRYTLSVYWRTPVREPGGW